MNASTTTSLQGMLKQFNEQLSSFELDLQDVKGLTKNFEKLVERLEVNMQAANTPSEAR